MEVPGNSGRPSPPFGGRRAALSLNNCPSRGAAQSTASASDPITPADDICLRRATARLRRATARLSRLHRATASLRRVTALPSRALHCERRHTKVLSPVHRGD